MHMNCTYQYLPSIVRHDRRSGANNIIWSAYTRIPVKRSPILQPIFLLTILFQSVRSNTNMFSFQRILQFSHEELFFKYSAFGLPYFKLSSAHCKYSYIQKSLICCVVLKAIPFSGQIFFYFDHRISLHLHSLNSRGLLVMGFSPARCRKTTQDWEVVGYIWYDNLGFGYVEHAE